MRRNPYKDILKHTALFGGVQVFQIIINLIRGKIVAMILGPAGMGVSSLFSTSSLTLQRFSSLGLNTAIVKETAAHGESENFRQVISASIRLASFAAAFGALICVAFAPLLSRLTFGDESWKWQFMLLGAAVGFSIAANAKLSVLQGMHKVRQVSKSSLFGSATGLTAGVPLYWFFGIQGIVPAMAVLAVSIWAFNSFTLRHSVGDVRGNFTWSVHGPIVRRLLATGAVLMASDLFLSLVQYAVNVYIRRDGSIDDVGLFGAANSITNQYAGLVFTAMSMDYFPRLSAVAGCNGKMILTVNRQTEIVALIIGPAVCLLILSAPLLIPVLLSEEFNPILPLIRWMGLGIMLRAIAVPMGYISFAKDNRRLFFWMEGVGCNVLTLILSITFYHRFGLTGLGYALVADNALCILIYYAVNRRLYGFRFSNVSLRLCSVAGITAASAFLASLIPVPALSWTAMAAISSASLLFSIRALRMRINE